MQQPNQEAIGQSHPDTQKIKKRAVMMLEQIINATLDNYGFYDEEMGKLIADMEGMSLAELLKQPQLPAAVKTMVDRAVNQDSNIFSQSSTKEAFYNERQAYSTSYFGTGNPIQRIIDVLSRLDVKQIQRSEINIQTLPFSLLQLAALTEKKIEELSLDNIRYLVNFYVNWSPYFLVVLFQKNILLTELSRRIKLADGDDLKQYGDLHRKLNISNLEYNNLIKVIAAFNAYLSLPSVQYSPINPALEEMIAAKENFTVIKRLESFEIIRLLGFSVLSAKNFFEKSENKLTGEDLKLFDNVFAALDEQLGRLVTFQLGVFYRNYLELLTFFITCFLQTMSLPIEIDKEKFLSEHADFKKFTENLLSFVPNNATITDLSKILATIASYVVFNGVEVGKFNNLYDQFKIDADNFIKISRWVGLRWQKLKQHIALDVTSPDEYVQQRFLEFKEKPENSLWFTKSQSLINSLPDQRELQNKIFVKKELQTHLSTTSPGDVDAKSQSAEIKNPPSKPQTNRQFSPDKNDLEIPWDEAKVVKLRSFSLESILQAFSEMVFRVKNSQDTFDIMYRVEKIRTFIQNNQKYDNFKNLELDKLIVIVKNNQQLPDEAKYFSVVLKIKLDELKSFANKIDVLDIKKLLHYTSFPLKTIFADLEKILTSANLTYSVISNEIYSETKKIYWFLQGDQTAENFKSLELKNLIDLIASHLDLPDEALYFAAALKIKLDQLPKAYHKEFVAVPTDHVNSKSEINLREGYEEIMDSIPPDEKQDSYNP